MSGNSVHASTLVGRDEEVQGVALRRLGAAFGRPGRPALPVLLAGPALALLVAILVGPFAPESDLPLPEEPSDTPSPTGTPALLTEVLPQDRPSAAPLPEGLLLIDTPHGGELMTSGGDTVWSTDAGRVDAISPDGSQLLLVTEAAGRADGPGATGPSDEAGPTTGTDGAGHGADHRRALTALELQGDTRSTAARASAGRRFGAPRRILDTPASEGGGLGHARPSPDGEAVAYSAPPAAEDPSRPGEHTRLCVVALRQGSEAECFGEAGVHAPVRGYAWLPSGDAVGVAAGELLLLDPASGEWTPLVSAQSYRRLEAAVQSTGSVLDEEFRGLAWSRSGAYFASFASIDDGAGAVAVLFRRDGRFAGMGTAHTRDPAPPAAEMARRLTWSPASDHLIYTRKRPLGSELVLHEPGAHHERVLHVEPGPERLTGVGWSPSGRWIAVQADAPDGGSRLQFLDTFGPQEPYSLPVDGRLVGWAE